MTDIHNLAVVSSKAKIGNNVKIGPFCVIGDNVELADNVELQSHVVIQGKTKIGKNTKIYPFASIGQTPQDLKYKGEDSEVIIGENNVIREYVTIQLGTESGGMKTIIGNNSLFMVGVHIAHDCIVADNVIFANVATVGGHAQIGNNVVLGGLCAVHQFVRIGDHAMIGGCTAVIRDVAPFATVTGERSGVDGMNILGLKRRGYDKQEILDLQKAFNKIFFHNDGDMKSSIEFVKNNYNSPLISQLIEFMESESKRSFTTSLKNKIQG
jgi:UDP-N-acetylglucosamine acyltransferase